MDAEMDGTIVSIRNATKHVNKLIQKMRGNYRLYFKTHSQPILDGLPSSF